MDGFCQRVLAELGHLPYLSGAGLGLLEVLHRATGPWAAAVVVDEPASPVVAWLRRLSGTTLHLWPKTALPGQTLPPHVPLAPWDAGTVPTFPADRERDLLDVSPIAFGLGCTVSPGRLRRLDDLLGDAPPVGLIAIGSLADAASVLGGAGRLLATAAPPVLLLRDARRDGPAVAAGLEAAAILTQAGYRLHDGLLTPCDSDASRRRALEGWLETLFLALPQGWDAAAIAGHAVVPDPAGAGRASAALNPAGLDGVWWRFLTGPRQVDGSETDSRWRVDELPVRIGFHPPERGDGIVWAWSGPDPRAVLRLPVGRPGYYRLCCRVMAVADGDVLATLRLFVNGRPIAHVLREDPFHTYIDSGFVLPQAHFTPAIELALAHRRTHRAGPADPRRVGFALETLSLERVAAP